MREERDLRRVFEFLRKNKDLQVIDRLLKEFWKTGRTNSKIHKKHTMHLAHGYEHAIVVANLSRDIARKINIDEKMAFTAGLLHDVYRPIEDDPMKPHGKLCAEIGSEILNTSKVFNPKKSRQITWAIRAHDLSVKEENLLMSPLGKTVFIADKSHMNIERVMAYVYDYIQYHGDKKYKPGRYLTMVDTVMSDVYNKFARDSKMLAKISNSDVKLEKWCKRGLQAWENTIQELLSQRDKEARKDDFPKTIRLFWAFKESISNFRFLYESEKGFHGKRNKDLYRSIHDTMGRYRQLLLTELDGEPFEQILKYRRLSPEFPIMES